MQPSEIMFMSSSMSLRVYVYVVVIVIIISYHHHHHYHLYLLLTAYYILETLNMFPYIKPCRLVGFTIR